MAVAVQLTPTRLGKFELLLPIGTGGMATVFLARAPVLAGVYRDVAVKLMHPHLGADGVDGPAMLLQEAEIAALVRHPNVVAVEEAAIDPAGVYLVMPYVEGDSLSGLMRAEIAAGGSMPRRIVARILCDALSGLHAAHELRDDDGRTRNVVHRDFTPSNIIVGADGTSRLTDFGIAKTASRIARTTTGQVKGKIGYMSPEQVRTLPLDRRADVWAAGVVAWECIAAQRLYGGDEVGVLLRIAQDVPPRLRSVCPDVPHPIDSAVAAALDPAIETRCASADELRQRLTTAFELDSGIADAAEVGAYVRRVAGAALADRRERVAAVLGSRAEPSSSREPAAMAIEALVTAPDGETTAVDFTRSKADRRPAASRGAVAAMVLGAAGLTGAIVYAVGRSPANTAQTAALVESPASTAATAAGAESASASASATPVDPRQTPTTPNDPPIASATVDRLVVKTGQRPAVRATAAAKAPAKGPKLGDYPGK